MIDANVLLTVSAQVNAGDFSARMPQDWTGVPGKVAEAFNELIVGNQAFEARALGQFDRVPIVAVTGKVLAGGRERFLQAGADDYIPKPVTTIELMGAITPRRSVLAAPTP